MIAINAFVGGFFLGIMYGIIYGFGFSIFGDKFAVFLLLSLVVLIPVAYTMSGGASEFGSGFISWEIAGIMVGTLVGFSMSQICYEMAFG